MDEQWSNAFLAQQIQQMSQKMTQQFANQSQQIQQIANQMSQQFANQSQQIQQIAQTQQAHFSLAQQAHNNQVAFNTIFLARLNQLSRDLRHTNERLDGFGVRLDIVQDMGGIEEKLGLIDGELHDMKAHLQDLGSINVRLEGIEGRLLRLAEFQKMTCRSLAQADEAVRRIADVETSTNVDKLRLQKMLISSGSLQHDLKPKENVPPENSSPLTLQARSALQEYAGARRSRLRRRREAAFAGYDEILEPD